MFRIPSPILSNTTPKNTSIPKKPFLAVEPKGPAVYFPKFTITLLLPSSHQKKKQAAFRIPSSLNKFDLYQYLTKIYGLNVLKITTYNFLAKYHKENGVNTRTRAWKKAIVDIDHEFEFPRVSNTNTPLKNSPSTDIDSKSTDKKSVTNEKLPFDGNPARIVEYGNSSDAVIPLKHTPQFRPAFRLKRKRGRRPMLARNQEAGVRKIPRKRSKNKYKPKPLKLKPPSVAIAASKLKRDSLKKRKGKDRRMMPRIIVASINQVPKEFLK